MYKLKTERFLLELRPELHQNDLPYPVNCSLGVSVSSYGFSAETIMDINASRLGEFAVCLNELYETLKGSAKLEEVYGTESFLEFTAVSRGYIRVRGTLHSGTDYGYTQELNFENEFDQTYLRSFAQDLLADYGRYAE